MRKTFHHYFRPTHSELRGLWENGLFCFDASVLLNVYGYSNETREELVSFIRKNAERVRLPYQFALEYARNRGSVIIRQVRNYMKVEKELDQIKQISIKPKRDHPYLSPQSLAAYEAIQMELAENRKAMEKLVGSDPYSETFLEVFSGKIGPMPTADELSQLEAKAKERYDARIPPGYEDLKEKGIPEAYGDCIGWQQLMQMAADEHKGIILAIDDFKSDWWYIEQERTVGPRADLLEEFVRVTQQQVYIYTWENFLRDAKEFIAADIRQEAIEEVTERLESQRQDVVDLEIKGPPRAVAPSDEAKSIGRLEEESVDNLKPTAQDLTSGEDDKSGSKTEPNN